MEFRRSSPVTPRKIRAMLADRSVAHVAADLDMDPAEVEAIASAGRLVVLHCNETGRSWRTTGWRGAYRRVCLLGLTDWDWWADREGAV